MKVLTITGDKKFGPGHERYELQKSAVETLAVVYWGRESVRHRIPSGHFDVVTAQDPFWRGLFGWYVAKKLSARFNVQVHTDLDAQPAWKRALARMVIRHADSVRVVSERIRRQIMHTHITALPVFVDISRFRNIARRPEPHTILWVGRFEEEKDPLRALRVFKEVLERIADATLVLLGAGSLEGALRHEISRLNLDMRVRLPGWQDPAPYLERATLVLSTSKHESWGASIIEALAAGVPVVAPDVGVAREAGAIVVPREQLAEAVKEVLTNPTPGRLLFEPLGKAAWQELFIRSLS